MGKRGGRMKDELPGLGSKIKFQEEKKRFLNN